MAKKAKGEQEPCRRCNGTGIDKRKMADYGEQRAVGAIRPFCDRCLGTGAVGKGTQEWDR